MHRLRIGDHCCIESNHLFPLNKISKNMAYISLTQIRNHCTNLWESWKWVKSSQLWTIVSPQISFQNVLNVYDEALRSPDFSKSVVFGQTPQIFHKHPRQLKFKHILWSVISIHGTEGTNEKTLWCLHVYSMICYGFKWVYNYFFMSTILCFLVMENQDKGSDLIRQNIIDPLGFSFLFLIICFCWLVLWVVAGYNCDCHRKNSPKGKLGPTNGRLEFFRKFIQIWVWRRP